ncbi:MAG: hypothetical protein SGPRY_009432 [Prymnesium sp.]
MHRETEALSLLSAARSAQEAQLAAQIKYRLGEHSEAAALFEQAEEGGSSSELSTNLLAALVGAERYEDALAIAASPPEGSGLQFEFFYNHACAAIGAGRLEEAQQLIGKALKLCRETLSTEDYSEEEIEVRHLPLPLLSPPFAPKEAARVDPYRPR